MDDHAEIIDGFFNDPFSILPAGYRYILYGGDEAYLVAIYVGSEKVAAAELQKDSTYRDWFVLLERILNKAREHSQRRPKYVGYVPRFGL